jgi:hypothetical protein
MRPLAKDPAAQYVRMSAEDRIPLQTSRQQYRRMQRKTGGRPVRCGTGRLLFVVRLIRINGNKTAE